MARLPLTGQREKSIFLFSDAFRVSKLQLTAYNTKVEIQHRTVTMPPKKQASTANRAALESIPQTPTSNDHSPTPPKMHYQSENDLATTTRTSKPQYHRNHRNTPRLGPSTSPEPGLLTPNALIKDLPWLKRECGDNPPPFIMEIKYANNPSHKKIGRQLWATFTWGKYTGVHAVLSRAHVFHQSCAV